ncbi:hypothetical protein NDU88_007893 [Pleurodeles waltl]|uniref:Uncharacterized protein n=1 Tax=Pleurodeles waltl TaxID=8319 RepID=A0AAV7RW33_PLEWA|nr:hypothetical protein NDU88_007893 [Pleurodeles waltl]
MLAMPRPASLSHSADKRCTSAALERSRSPDDRLEERPPPQQLAVPTVGGLLLVALGAREVPRVEAPPCCRGR